MMLSETMAVKKIQRVAKLTEQNRAEVNSIGRETQRSEYQKKRREKGLPKKMKKREESAA
jgi:hypothetical protein